MSVIEVILKKILKAYGWQKLLSMAWNAVQDDLAKAAAKTDTKIDDKGVEILDGLIDLIVSDEKAA